MNSRDNFAGAAGLSFDYRFHNSFAAGINFTASNNFDGITVLEPAALFRWNFLGAFFAQADLGAFLVLEEGETSTMFMGGLRAGLRTPLGQALYLEPYGRAGYPFMFGFGALAGMRF